MKKLDYIKIHNFKAFQDEETISIGGKNLLVYGNNGSGKSSIYWALYTFLQCSEKSDEQKENYFAIYDDADPNTFQSLRNVFINEASDPYIEIKYKDIADAIKFSPTDLNSIDCDDIRTANMASDFINYKLLHNFYNSTHKHHINLWEVFERDMFPFLKPNLRTETFKRLLDSIKSNLPKYSQDKGGRFFRRNSWRYIDYQNNINEFNLELNAILGQINLRANNIFKDKFKNADLKIILELSSPLTWDDGNNREFNNPEIKLSVKYRKGTNELSNHRPQSFLNEATLTRIALSIRLGALFTRLAASETKLLILDDMLISLDMSNRMIVTSILLEDVKLVDFQKIILTHDKAFFNIIKSNTNLSEWSYLSISKDENVFNSKPQIKPELSDLEKARVLYENQEFETCANHLRKEVEHILKNHLKRGIDAPFTTLSDMLNQAINKIEKDRYVRMKKLVSKSELPLEKLKTDIDADDTLSPEIKGKLKSLKSELFNFVIKETQNNSRLEQVLNELKKITDRVLNPASHHTSISYYSAEINDAINKIAELRDLIV